MAVVAARARHVERVYGPDLMLACCEASVTKGYRHFFYGGGPGVPERLRPGSGSASQG